MEEKNDSIKVPREKIEVQHIDPNEEQRSLSRGSKELNRCSSLGLTDKEVPVEELAAQLAEIIVDAYFYEKRLQKSTRK